MANILYITANVKDASKSYSITVGDAFINAYRMNHPEDEITRLDLFKMDIPLLDATLIAAMFGQIQPREMDAGHALKFTLLTRNQDQFIAADKYVFVTPMWNLGAPPVVKAYFDNISAAGKTFQYTENGAAGLLTGKKAVHIQASGGIYHSDPLISMDNGAAYIKNILALFGVADLQQIFIEGVDIEGTDIGKIKTDAIAKAVEIAKKF